MNELPKRLFESLKPPRGGLAGLRARIENDDRRRATVWRARLALAGVAVLVVAGLFAFHGKPGAPALLPEFQQARVSLGLAEPPAEAFTLAAGQRHRVAAQRVELNSDRVVFYRVAAIAPELTTVSVVD